MTHRVFGPCGLASILLVCAFFPGTGRAQVGVGIGVGGGRYGPYGPGFYGPGFYGTGPNSWNYPGLGGGPFLTTAYPFVGWPGYRGAFGSFWTNGLSLYGPPVPVYGPIPGVFGNNDLVRQWQARPTLGLGLGYYGWVGPFAASPRPRYPTVNSWPTIESVPAATPPAGAAPGAGPGACLYLSVKVPQPAAEVFIDGVRMTQRGTDRLYESPALAAGQEYQYELTARWLERGVACERKKVVTGKPGEVVRVDFLTPDVVTTGR